MPVYLEVGTRRAFAGALEWPGWSRSGRDEDSALQALVEYGPRYAEAVGHTAAELPLPTDSTELVIVERLEGNATTDFGAPGVAPSSDAGPVDEAEARRLTGLLEACWAKCDRAAQAASGLEFRKGPRGGGRELDAIVDHVLQADAAYLSRLGGKYRARGDDVTVESANIREAFLQALSSRVRGEPPPPTRRAPSLWSPRYAVRRSAWHALDHAWEIEDRALGSERP
jgi:hypothetical protein